MMASYVFSLFVYTTKTISTIVDCIYIPLCRWKSLYDQNNFYYCRLIHLRASISFSLYDQNNFYYYRYIMSLGTSNQSISQHIINILKGKELETDSVVKHYLTTESNDSAKILI